MDFSITSVNRISVLLGLVILLLPMDILGERAKFKKVRSSAYEDIRVGKHVTGNVNSLDSVTTRPKCGVACNRDEDCLSFTFCGNGTCYLKDVFSTGSRDGILEDDESCSYFGMKKQAVPLCQSEEEMADIRNESTSGVCRISRKRIDQEWTQWQIIDVIDTGTEWKSVNRRDLITEAAHGGYTGETESEQVVWWVHLVKERLLNLENYETYQLSQ